MICRAPERLHGDDASIRADLFSTGVVLLSLLIGHIPVKGHSAEDLSQSWKDFDPTLVRKHRPDITPSFLDWLAWMLRFDAGKRPTSAQQAQDALLHTTTTALIDP